MRFFYGREILSIPEDAAFFEMYQGVLQIAAANADLIEGCVGQDWNTSISKVVDNAAVGYMLAHGPRASGRERH
jgi:hypothetical protein